MLDYVIKLTRQLPSVSEDDIAKLRQVGLSDAAILDINQVAAYYNFVNRIADGLGVELEPYWSAASSEPEKIRGLTPKPREQKRD